MCIQAWEPLILPLQGQLSELAVIYQTQVSHPINESLSGLLPFSGEVLKSPSSHDGPGLWRTRQLWKCFGKSAPQELPPQPWEPMHKRHSPATREHTASKNKAMPKPASYSPEIPSFFMEKNLFSSLLHILPQSPSCHTLTSSPIIPK